jgi:F-type H+-transporting ATPase subunit gamma
MPSLKEVKNRISSVSSTQQITKAMKMVAAAKLRRAQDNIIQLRPYAQKLNGILQNLTAGEQEHVHPLAVQKHEERILLVAISSDKGLCGAFNSNVFKAVTRLLQENYAEAHAAGKVTILPIGKKAYEFFNKRNYPLVDEYRELISRISFEKVQEAARFAMNAFQQGKYDKVEIVYNEFKNVATQILNVEQYLPIVPHVQDDRGTTLGIDYIYQPNEEEIVRDLIPMSLEVQLFKAVLESNASEHGARMTAMDKATENAGELLKELKLTYNRTRQAAITKEILEIVGGAEALG